MFLRTLFFLFLAATPSAMATFAFPQSLRPSSQDKYSLTGAVINSVTGEPIRGVLVQIYVNGKSSRVTGREGQFQFDGLFAGQTPITVRKPGFFSEEELETRSARFTRQVATIGRDVSPAIVKLIPESVIYGRITGDDGEPIENLPVQLVVQRLENGRKVWQDRPGGSTNEDGEFRIAELQPGTYYLSAGPSSNPESVASRSSHPLAMTSRVATGNSPTAALPLTVTPDLPGIQIILLPSANIPIPMRLISSRTGAERFTQQENYFPAYVQLVLHSSGMFESRHGSQQVGERGSASLELQSIPPVT